MKSSRDTTNRSSKAGLTFVEVLLSIALLTMILGTAAQVLFSLAHCWRESEDEPRLRRHAEGVAGFLSYAFSHSSYTNAPHARRNGQWQRPPESRHQTFSFSLADGHPFFVTPFLPVPPVNGWLLFDRTAGLSLLWHVPPSLTAHRRLLQRTLLSSWVKDVEIGYFDRDRNLWEYESLADDEAGTRRAPPGSLRIVFERDGQEITRYVKLDRHDQNEFLN